jgi:hypothetical protein|tara:strand:- start:166 stop:330 length:165 start_codon:yes stop_codon:yes gene_type:complete
MKTEPKVLLKFILLVMLVIVFLGFASQMLFWLFNKFGMSMATMASFNASNNFFK